MRKVIEKIIEDTFKQVDFLIRNSNRLKEMSGGMFNPDKLVTFRDYLAIIYLLKMNEGSLSKLGHKDYLKILDAGVMDEFMFDMAIVAKKEEYNLVG